MAKLQLFGGEMDGWEMKNVPVASRPDVFYAVPRLDEDKIKSTSGSRAKQELRQKLATLAYKFDPDRSTANHFKMTRCPELDRVPQG
jgi:hypothetical protein